MDVQKVVFMLMAQEMDRAISFYRDTIGLKLQLHEGSWAMTTRWPCTVGAMANTAPPVWDSPSPTSLQRGKR